MDITFACESCGQSIVIDEAGAGRDFECPKCGEAVHVPRHQAQKLKRWLRPGFVGTATQYIKDSLEKPRWGRPGAVGTATLVFGFICILAGLIFAPMEPVIGAGFVLAFIGTVLLFFEKGSWFDPVNHDVDKGRPGSSLGSDSIREWQEKNIPRSPPTQRPAPAVGPSGGQVPLAICEELKKYKSRMRALCLECGYQGPMGIQRSVVHWTESWPMLILYCCSGIGTIILILIMLKGRDIKHYVVCPNCKKVLGPC